MSEKVRVAWGIWGMESRRGGGEIPKRLRISQPKEITLDLPFSHCRHAAYVKKFCTKIEKRPNVKTVVEADAEKKKPAALMLHKTTAVEHCERTAS